MWVKIMHEDPLDNAIYLVHHLAQSLTKTEDIVNSKLGLRTKQFGVLVAIKSLPEPVTPSDVAEWLNHETKGITLTIDRMERGKLITRVRDLQDRRSVRITLTEKGEEMYERGVRSQKALYQKIMSNLNTNELQTLNSLLDRVLETTFEIRDIKDKIKEYKA